MSGYIAPPREASADRLLYLCEVLGTEKMDKQTLANQADGGTDAVYDTVRYGERLGFLRVDQEGVSTTFLGRQARNELDNSSRQALFQTGLSFYTLYVDLLNRSVDITDLPDRISRESLIIILNEDFGLEMSEKTTKERIHKFMRTLEEAGLGEFKSGNQHRDTGFEFAPEADHLTLEVVSMSALGLVSGSSEQGIKTGPASNIIPTPAEEDEKQQTTLPEATEDDQSEPGNEEGSEEANGEIIDDQETENDDGSSENRDELFFTEN